MAKTRMLVVDDARLVRMFVKKAFRHYPEMAIEEAEDGVQAQSLLKESDFDLVLCDWDMPQMSGHELLSWMRTEADNRLRDLPFVMVTSSGEKEKVVQAVKMGVSGYIVKPFSSNQLLRQVKDVLAKRQEGPRANGKAEPALDEAACTTQIRFQGGAILVELRNVTTKGLIGRFPNSEPMPKVLSPVVTDLKRANSDETVSFPGYVFRLETAEDSPKPKHFNLGVRFVDVTGTKKEFLIDFITAFRC